MFVSIDEDVQGLVHISEVMHGFVKDINDHLTIGDEVQVKILDIDEENNKVSLSIRATQDKPSQQTRPNPSPSSSSQESGDAGFNTLKEKLQEWIEHSEAR